MKEFSISQLVQVPCREHQNLRTRQAGISSTASQMYRELPAKIKNSMVRQLLYNFLQEWSSQDKNKGRDFVLMLLESNDDVCVGSIVSAALLPFSNHLILVS